MTTRQAVTEKTKNTLSPLGRHWYPLCKGNRSTNDTSDVSVKRTPSKYGGVPAFN